MPKTSPPTLLEADQTLDVTADVCPMTFVRTRLALERMAPGETLLVLLRGPEPRRNVPASAVALGHRILAEHAGPDDLTQLWVRRA
jgi:tRNA 2-thiouridine synthesizing protein A